MEQPTLIETPSFFDEHWTDMPEFEQNKKEPYACIKIRFKSESDLQDFAQLIDQKLTQKTKSTWFPFKSHWREGEQPVWLSHEF